MRAFWVVTGLIPVLLAGCQAPGGAVALQPPVVNPPMSSIERVGSDTDDFYDRAAPAAQAAIETYLAMTDEITSASGQGSDRMRAHVTERWWPTEQSALAAWEGRQERTIGQTRFEEYRLQLARVTPEGDLDIAMFGCVDSSRVVVLGPEEDDPPGEVIDWLAAGERYVGTDEQWEVIEEYLLQGPLRTGGRTSVVFWLTGPSLDQLRVDVSEDWWGEHGC